MRHLRTKFVIELYKDLKKEQAKDIENQELKVIINDIRVFMRNKSKPEYKTNQGDLEMKQLFHGIIIKAWFGVNFSLIKYGNYNKIIIQHCLNYYQTCQYNCNKVANDRIMQRDRMKQQYKKEQNRVLEGEYLQVAKYAKKITLISMKKAINK